MNEQVFVIRAMPPGGLPRRFRAGRAWGKDPVTVTVVENPAPDRTEKDRDGRVMITYSNQITPTQLEQLRADPHFAVSALGPAGADAGEMNEAKAAVVALEQQLLESRRELAGALEDMKALRLQASKEAEEAGDRIMALEQSLADAKSQLAATRKSKERG